MNSLNLKFSTLAARCSVRILLGIGLVMATATVSAAKIENESNDTFLTANFADPMMSNTGIIGNLSGASNDVDIWKFDLTAGAGFGASISNGPGTDFNLFNPLIVLYMENAGNYYAVAGNNPNAFSTSLGFLAWESGTYFLTVSAERNSPEDQLGNGGYDAQFHSFENGLGTPFFQFGNQSFTSFDYTLAFTGTVNTTVVPVPAAAWLFASGLLGFIGVSRRSRRIA